MSVTLSLSTDFSGIDHFITKPGIGTYIQQTPISHKVIFRASIVDNVVALHLNDNCGMLRMGAHFRPYISNHCCGLHIDSLRKISGWSYSLIPPPKRLIKLSISVRMTKFVCLASLGVSNACILSLSMTRGLLEWHTYYFPFRSLYCSRCDGVLYKVWCLPPTHSTFFSRVSPFHRLDSCRLTTFNKSISHSLCPRSSSKQLSRRTIITFKNPFF